TAVMRSPDRPQMSVDEAAAKWAARFKQSGIYKKYIIEPAEKPDGPKKTEETALSNRRLRIQRRGTFLQQTRVLTERTFKLAIRDIRTILAMIVVLPLVGLFLGFINLDKIDSIRGQMLVNRFEGDSTLAVFM